MNCCLKLFRKSFLANLRVPQLCDKHQIFMPDLGKTVDSRNDGTQKSGQMSNSDHGFGPTNLPVLGIRIQGY